MSSHTLDMSGQRQLALTLNDPAVTKAWAPSSQGDDVSVQLSGREVRIITGGALRIQRRSVEVSKTVYEDGVPKKVDGSYVYEKVEEERLVLVFPGSLSAFVRSSLTPDIRALPDDDELKPKHEHHTMTSVLVRRRKDDEWDYSETGSLVSEVTLEELLASSE